MLRCTRKGCGLDFDEDDNSVCIHHPGAPVFHEGLKSWSCCKDQNKPVLDFDEFLSIPGCMEADAHTAIAIKPESTSTTTSITPAPNTSIKHADGQETFTITAGQSVPTPNSTTGVRAPPPEEEDDLSVSVPPGTACRRKGCGTQFISNEVNRLGDGEDTICTYHPAPPIFREGSKGYLCCKRRVLEFDEFLKIPGCKIGRHCFVPVASVGEEQTTCRMDHYQTLDKVYVSIFAKQADRVRSKVAFSNTKVELDLLLPGSKRFTKTLDLFGPIDPSQSVFHFLNNKVEIVIKKSDTRSWNVLQKTENSGNFNLTFGVGGRTGTVGGKDIILDESNKLKG